MTLYDFQYSLTLASRPRLISIFVLTLALTFSLESSPILASQRLGKKGKPQGPSPTVEQSDDEQAPKTRQNNKGQTDPKTDNRRVRATLSQKSKSRQSAPAPPRGSRSRRVEDVEDSTPVQAPASTDYSSARIEAIEYDSARYHQVSRQISQTPGGRTSSAESKGKVTVSNRRIDVDIDPERVTEIQRALIERGFLTGEPSGIYDEATIEAMRQFQISQQIDVTGYPTAHSLKRLGLTK